jgi:Domain of unknown function (DUF4410)
MSCSAQALRRSLIWFFALLPTMIVSPPAHADEDAPARIMGELKADTALVYLVREYQFQGGGRSVHVYADDALAGVLDNDCFGFTYLSPGKHLLWLNWTGVYAQIEVAAGRVYFFNLLPRIRQVDERAGMALVGGIEEYCEPDAGDRENAIEEIAERYDKAREKATRKPVVLQPVLTAANSVAEPTNPVDKRTSRRVSRWPKVDLTQYSTLFVEDFAIVDPKADERSNQALVQSASKRLPDIVVADLGATAFAEVLRGAPSGPRTGTVILRARLSQYKPGSKTARTLLLGAGSAQLEMEGELVDAESGRILARMPVDRTWAWGGALGAAVGILEMERDVASELAFYLESGRGVAPTSMEH